MFVGHREGFALPPGSVSGSVLTWDATTQAYVDSSRAIGGPGSGLAYGLTLANTSPATAGGGTYSQALQLLAQSYVAASGTRTVGWRIYAYGSAAGSYYSNIAFDNTVDGTTWGTRLSYTSSANAWNVGAHLTVSGGNITCTGTGGYISANGGTTALVACSGRIYGLCLDATGDPGGTANRTTLTNATVAAGGSAATLINAPAAAAQVGWIKIYVGTTAYVVPYWAAA